MGFLDWLKGPGGQADADPNPGITIPAPARGPAGQTGNPGTTSWTRENPQAAAEKRPHAPDRPVSTPPWGQHVTRPRYLPITEQQADTIPPPASNGGLPFQGPDSMVNPDRVRDTEQRPRTIISRNIPGGQNQRNSTYYGGRQAIPGTPHTYKSASKGDHFPITESSLPSRYVFGGVNGGTDALDDLLADRRMPYTGHDDYRGQLGHARGSRRGAVLDGDRFYQEADGFTSGNQGGSYGSRVRGSRRHRPVQFAEPAPMNSQYYDTTASTGTAGQAGTSSQVQEQIHVSPSATRRGWRR